MLHACQLQEALPPDTFRLLAQKSPHAVFKNGEGVRALAQLSFRATQLSQAEEPNEALDRAFTVRPAASSVGTHRAAALTRRWALQALRLLNSGYAAEIEERRRQRAARSQRDGVSFSIGQIVYHTRYRYKVRARTYLITQSKHAAQRLQLLQGVVYGWDAECQRSPEWARQVKLKLRQCVRVLSADGVWPDAGACRSRCSMTSPSSISCRMSRCG